MSGSHKRVATVHGLGTSSLPFSYQYSVVPEIVRWRSRELLFNSAVKTKAE